MTYIKERFYPNTEAQQLEIIGKARSMAELMALLKFWVGPKNLLSAKVIAQLKWKAESLLSQKHFRSEEEKLQETVIYKEILAIID